MIPEGNNSPCDDGTSQDKKVRALQVILGIAIAAGILSFLAVRVSLDDLRLTISEISVASLLLVFVIYTLANVLRAYRFGVLLSGRAPFVRLTGTVMICNFVTAVLPVGLGQLSYPALFKRRFGLPLAQGVPILLLARVFDLIALCCIFLLALVSAEAVPASQESLMLSIGLLVLAVLLCLIVALALLRFSDRAVSRLQLLSDKLLYRGPASVKKMVDKVIEGFTAVRVIDSTVNLAKIAASSLGIWGCMYLVGFILVRDLNIDLDIASCFTAQGLTLVTIILPIQGVGGFGTFEGAWAAAFILLGVAESTAILSGVIVHLVLFVYQGILGLLGAVITR